MREAARAIHWFGWARIRFCHLPLHNMSAEDARREISESRHRLESEIGETVAHFAYRVRRPRISRPT